MTFRPAIILILLNKELSSVYNRIIKEDNIYNDKNKNELIKVLLK
jgi:hypothetical protein